MTSLDELTAKLETAIALLQTTQDKLDAIEERFGQLERELHQEPETAYQSEAARLLRRNPRTLQRWREQGKLAQGLHWWPENGDGPPIYNLTLIRDGQRQGFASAAHQRACANWLKNQPSTPKKKRA